MCACVFCGEGRRGSRVQLLKIVLLRLLVLTACIIITAAKAALFRFIQSRETSQREKDLLKSVKVY